MKASRTETELASQQKISQLKDQLQQAQQAAPHNKQLAARVTELELELTEMLLGATATEDEHREELEGCTAVCDDLRLQLAESEEQKTILEAETLELRQVYEQEMTSVAEAGRRAELELEWQQSREIDHAAASEQFLMVTERNDTLDRELQKHVTTIAQLQTQLETQQSAGMQLQMLTRIQKEAIEQLQAVQSSPAVRQLAVMPGVMPETPQREGKVQWLRSRVEEAEAEQMELSCNLQQCKTELDGYKSQVCNLTDQAHELDDLRTTTAAAQNELAHALEALRMLRSKCWWAPVVSPRDSEPYKICMGYRLLLTIAVNFACWQSRLLMRTVHSMRTNFGVARNVATDGSDRSCLFLRQELADTRRMLSLAQTECERLDAEVGTVRSTLVEVQVKSVEEAAQMRVVMASAKAEITLSDGDHSETRTLLCKARDRVLSLLEQAADSETALADVQVENASMCAQLEQAQQEAADALQNAQKLQEAINQANAAASTVKAEVKVLREQEASTLGQQMTVVTKLRAAEASLAAAEAARDAARNESKRLANQMMEVEAESQIAAATSAAELKKAESAVCVIEESLHVAQASLEEARNEISRLIGRLTADAKHENEARYACEQKQAAIEQKQANIEELRSDHQQLLQLQRTEIIQLKDRLDTAMRREAQLKERVGQVKQRATAAQTDLQAEIAMMKVELSQARENGSKGVQYDQLLIDMHGKLEVSLSTGVSATLVTSSMSKLPEGQAELNGAMDEFVVRHKRDLQFLEERLAATKREMNLQERSHKTAMQQMERICKAENDNTKSELEASFTETVDQIEATHRSEVSRLKSNIVQMNLQIAEENDKLEQAAFRYEQTIRQLERQLAANQPVQPVNLRTVSNKLEAALATHEANSEPCENPPNTHRQANTQKLQDTPIKQKINAPRVVKQEVYYNDFQHSLEIAKGMAPWHSALGYVSVPRLKVGERRGSTAE